MNKFREKLKKAWGDFLPVGHCFTEWSKINLKVYDVLNCLNKNILFDILRIKKVWNWNFVHLQNIK